MNFTADEKRQTDFGYWARCIENNSKYFLSNGAKHDEKLFKASSKCISSYKAMIEGKEYIEAVKLFYSFLETEFGFSKVNETINGNAFYDVEFKDREKVGSVSYENIENHLEVIVFMLENGKLPDYDYDDKTKTLHLKQLNKLMMTKASKEDVNLNAEYFVKCTPKNEIERKLLKEAKELRLCLKYFNEIQLA